MSVVSVYRERVVVVACVSITNTKSAFVYTIFV